ncbi:DUF6166 domain-containing protein [Deinococcus ruber]|uniref:Uncharacterized protein n=1 Tax=Deinococcus ruber TaxID=1848197 RepID=A0A918KXV8_9DEIO|nr:DUF6166 domain-containing protein [Deinococcus ruber]GGR41590.1 hypothetical protein GCM10008957_56770 [Deinococcus ruber]
MQPDPTAPDVHLLLQASVPVYQLHLGGVDVTSRFPSRPVHHSPSGIAWGYGGSGPCDLALLVMSLHFPLALDVLRTSGEVFRQHGFPLNPDAWEQHELTLAAELSEVAFEQRMTTIEQDLRALPRRSWDGQWVSAPAWQQYLDFKRDCIQTLDQHSGHVLLAADVRSWLRRRAALTTTPSLTEKGLGGKSRDLSLIVTHK